MLFIAYLDKIENKLLKTHDKSMKIRPWNNVKMLGFASKSIEIEVTFDSYFDLSNDVTLFSNEL